MYLRRLIISLQYWDNETDDSKFIAEFTLDEKHKPMFYKLSKKMFELDENEVKQH